MKLSYIALHEGTPIIASSSFEVLKQQVDAYFGVNSGNISRCVSWDAYDTKFSDAHEGHWIYETLINNDREYDRIEVYCLDLIENKID
jgi:hypothetical protein